MKRLIFLLIIVGSVLHANAQTNLFWTILIKAKMDKKLEWEKKMPVIVKTHHPDAKYRTYQILTGENSGAYFIAMGPMTYKDLDQPPVFPKGEAAMKADFQTLDAITESTEVNHYARVTDLSSMKADRKLKYVQVTSVVIQVGQWGRVREILKSFKEARDLANSKMDIDFFRPASSGTVNAFTHVRYVEKLEDLDLEEDLVAAYEKVHGDNSLYKLQQEYFSLIKSVKSELRMIRSDLSSL
jgi:hypothetical protein